MFDPTILMGVELEVEVTNDLNELQVFESKHKVYGSYPKHHFLGFTHKKHGSIVKIVDELCDGSITTHYDNTVNDGFEWIGIPMSMKGNKKMWGELLTHPEVAPYIHGDDVKVTKGQYGIHDCGMHVHVSGDPLTPLILGKIFMFVNSKNNKTFIEYIAGRSLNQFCQTQPLQKINTFKYLYHSRNCKKTTKRGKRIVRTSGGGWDITSQSQADLTMGYCCNNGLMLGTHPFNRGAMWVTPSYNTGDYEIRFFKSTVQVDRFYANLEFVVALIDFCHQVGMAQLTFKDFGEWVSSLNNRLRYPYLFKFMRTGGYTKGVIPKSTTLKALIAKGKLGEPIKAAGSVR